MISAQLCLREEVEQRLRHLGCQPAGHYLETGELWVTPSGYHLIVPSDGAYRVCDRHTLDAVEREVRILEAAG